MLFNALNGHPELWSLYRESGELIERYFPVSMERGSSDAVTESDASFDAVVALRQQFANSVGNMGSGHIALSNRASAFLRTSAGRRFMRVPVISKLRLSALYSRFGRQGGPECVRIVEKTPENCFRIQLLLQLFPDSLFVYITRDPRQSIASIYRGWTQSKEFRRFQLPEWFGIRDFAPRWWSFGLFPGWESSNGTTLMEICARQWLTYNQHCHRDLPCDASRVLTIPYEQAVREPVTVLRRLAHWASLDPSPFDRFGSTLPIVNTFTDPGEDKWRDLEAEIEAIEPVIREEAMKLGYQW